MKYKEQLIETYKAFANCKLQYIFIDSKGNMSLPETKQSKRIKKIKNIFTETKR